MITVRTTDRRNLLLAGAAAAAAVGVVATPQTADAQSAGGGALPNLYPNSNARVFRAIQSHENAHVAFLLNALGAAARPRPTFQGLTQPDIRTFGTVAVALENTGSGAYLGAAPVIFSKQYLAAAGSIALIEARHSGFLNVLFNKAVTADVFGNEQQFEQPLTIAQVVNLAGPFIANLNGGPPLTFNSTPSKANDISILNFALALEYLEQDFYNVNVPKFFPAG